MESYKICVSTAFGVEAATKRELENLGYHDLRAENGKIVFSGTLSDVARCNLLLRTANKVFLVLGTFPAGSFDEVFGGVRDLPLEDYLPKNAAMPISGKTAKSDLFAFSATQRVIKKAVCERLMQKYRVSELPEDGKRYGLEFFLYKNEGMLCLNTSGDGLHKRGYRSLASEAPLKETLAAAMLDLSVWNPDKILVDPFTGSGTIPIEAAMIACRIPAGGNRGFDFTAWGEAYERAFLEEKERALSLVTRREVRIQGYDIDEKQISLARYHAKNAGVADCVHFQVRDMRELSSHTPYGVIVTNPPYGKRLGTERETALLMRDFGKTFARLPDWSAYVITAFPALEREFGKTADKKRKLFNGDLECCYYTFMGAKPPKRKTNEETD